MDDFPYIVLPKSFDFSGNSATGQPSAFSPSDTDAQSTPDQSSTTVCATEPSHPPDSPVVACDLSAGSTDVCAGSGPSDVVCDSNTVVDQPADVFCDGSAVVPYSTDISTSVVPAVVVRRSSRLTQKPSYLRDYHCNLIHNLAPTDKSLCYPLDKHLSYQSLSSSHKSFVLNISCHFEPRFYHEAVPFSHWRVAMNDEL